MPARDDESLREPLLKPMAAMVLLCSIAFAAAPKGWFLAGSHPAAYDTGTDSETTYEGRPSAYLKSIRADICQDEAQSATPRNPCRGFGTLMQNFGAEQYQGKRIRFSALVRSEDVDEWAGLWMRVDKGSSSVAFDNMQERPIKETSGWQRYDVVLDVPPGSTGIAFGILLAGRGAVWMNSVKFEIVGADVPVSGPHAASAPANLGFEK